MSKEEKQKKYIILRTLGKGSFGKVKEALHVLTGEKIAIKILEKSRIKKDDDLMRIRREMSILKKVNHPNIIKLYEIIETNKYFFFVMEYIEKGELSHYIENQANYRLTEDESCKFFQQLISAVDYLHKNGCAHRDVKPSNILVTSDLDLKLIDFGLGNLYTEDEKLRTACGSPCYAAPEIIAGENYDPIPVDIWSSGITLFAKLCGYLPFDEESKSLLYKKILACDYSIPSHVSPDACDLLRRILVRDPNVRLNIEQIKEHDWFKKYKPCQVQAGFILGKSVIPLDKMICKITAKKMKVPAKVINKMIKENEHNKYTTAKKEKGEFNEEKYSVDENDPVSSSDEEIGENYLEEEFFKPRTEPKTEIIKPVRRVKSQVKYRPKSKRSKKNKVQRKVDKSKNSSSISMDIKRPPAPTGKKIMRANSKEKSIKRSRSKKRSKRNSMQDELPKISANINDIALEERATSNTRSSNKSKNRPSAKYNFKDLFNNSRRKNYHDIKKKIFSKSNGNKKKKASVNREKGYMYNTNQSFKKGNSLRNWKKNLYISTDGRNDQDVSSSPPKYSKNYSKSSQAKDSKKNFLSKMLKKMLHRKKSPKVNFRKDYLGPQPHHRTSQSYNTPTYSYFSNNGSSRRKSSKDRKNTQFFTNPNYSHSVNASKVHRRNYSKDFVTYIDSPMYLRQTKTTKSRDYKIREMSYDTGAGKGKSMYKRQKSKKKLSGRKKKQDRLLDVYKSKKMKMRNVKLRKKIGALRSKKQ